MDPPRCGCTETASADTCVFMKALLARAAVCALAGRRALGERTIVTCTSPVAHTNCRTLAALLHERATFALKLPRNGAPIVHAKALQLQCGGVLGLQQALGADAPHVHRLVGLAHARWGSLIDAPWDRIVPTLTAWRPRRRSAAPLP